MSNITLVQIPEPNVVDDKATALTRARYQHISPFYDRMEALLEKRIRSWRRRQ